MSEVDFSSNQQWSSSQNPRTSEASLTGFVEQCSEPQAFVVEDATVEVGGIHIEASSNLKRKKEDDEGANNDNEAKRAKYHALNFDFIEAVAAFKCKLCNFLSLDVAQVDDHVSSSHEEYAQPQDWLEVAQKENIRLHCPRCDNSFISEGSRSFKVHLMDDHSFSEVEAETAFEEQNRVRRGRALIALRDLREARKIKRTAFLNKPLEAYVDERGELRVRSVPEDDDNDIDVSAEKYFTVVKEKEEEKAPVITNSTSSVIKAKKSFIANEEPPSSSTSKMGRKKGSKSVGLSKLKLLNPNISMSLEILGSACPEERCGVRLKDPEKMKYHQRCHVPNESDYVCPECREKTNVRFSGVWAKLAMHLWREHRIDMELLSCPKCPDFRAFNRARCDDHLTKHTTERPHKCDQCEKAFKQERHLKDHLVRGHGKQRHYETNEELKKFQCRMCDRAFKTQSVMLNHVRTVHEGVRPFACRFCDYTSSNRSNLKIHERQHTGEKPYSCDYCEYRAADRNSLNKHLMRHTGVKRFFCQLCDFGTIQSVNLGYHYSTVHCDEAVRRGLLYKCKLCKYFSIRQESFYAHLTKQHDQPWPSSDKSDAAKEEDPSPASC